MSDEQTEDVSLNWRNTAVHYDDPEKERRFKNANGTFKTSALFLETAYRNAVNGETPPDVLFTLKDNDYRGLPSLRRKYLEAKDPTEYQFALENFYGWEHWALIRDQDWIRPKLDKWREELQASILSEALTSVVEEATNPISRSRLAAAKYLLESKFEALKGIVNEDTKNRGKRAIKPEVSEEDQRLQEIEQRAILLFKGRQKSPILNESNISLSVIQEGDDGARDFNNEGRGTED